MRSFTTLTLLSNPIGSDNEAGGMSRTCDLQAKNLLLYTELPRQIQDYKLTPAEGDAPPNSMCRGAPLSTQRDTFHQPGWFCELTHNAPGEDSNLCFSPQMDCVLPTKRPRQIIIFSFQKTAMEMLRI